MGREDGFVVADVSSGHFDDDKVRRLWRILGNVPDMTEAMALHLATVLGSWRHGRRMTVEESVPLWLPIRSELVDALVSAKLLDRSTRVPIASWNDWYGPANARREARRESGRLGGLASGKVRSSDASATPNPSVRPSVPSVRPSRGRAREGSRAPRENGEEKPTGPLPTSLREAIAGTPLGEEIERRSQGEPKR